MPNVMIILDDILSTGSGVKKARNMDTFNHLVFNGRHYNFISVFLLQDITGMNRRHFSNAGAVVLFQTYDYSLREYHYYPKIMCSVLHQFPEVKNKGKRLWFSVFNMLFDGLERYECFVFIRDPETNKNMMYRHKAPVNF